MCELHLVQVEFETLLGATYSFPDMNLEEVEHLLKDFHQDRDITLVNMSRACLVIPPRIVKTIRVGGEERWTR